MGFASQTLYFLVHPQELRNIIQWKLWHHPIHERDEDSEPVSLKMCFLFLDKTSRSFSAVIKELNPELLVPITLFYLSLRGLDTIEDDMTISLDQKDPLLRDFHNILEKEGWNFDGNGPNEKDRELLVKFQHVVTEFNKLKPEYKKIIKDITKKMGNGMADYASNDNGVESIEDYEIYCHYVAGLVGEGLTRLFVEGNLANTALLQRPELHESMGQFLQQTNIIRDVREDRDDRRRFWPQEVWSKYVTEWDDIFRPENKEAALRCSSEMVLLALERAPDCLFYLAGLRDQSVFNFAAIPQAMAIATLELCFRNYAIYERNVKITKGDACKLMWDSSQNLQVLFDVFRRYARRIHKKNDPTDPNFLKISIACGKLEQFIESVFPSQNPRVITGEQPGDKSKTQDGLETADAKRQREKESSEAKWDVFVMGAAAFVVLLLTSSIMMVVAWYFGARFDLVWASLRGNMPKEAIKQKLTHGEL